MDIRQQALQVVCALICTEKRREKKKRIWMKEWIAARGLRGLSALQRELEMNDRTGFRERLRMTAEEFDFLLGLVEPCISRQDTKMRLAISPRDRLSLTLRFLATGETFRSLRLQYRIGTSTISGIVIDTCAALYDAMKSDFLKTPSTEAEWRTIAQDFYHRWQFPHCLGALDGKHIHVQPPARSGSTYLSDKNRFSVVLMAVVDAQYKFIYASVGTQIRASDAGLFTHSDLCRAMDQGLLNTPLPEPLPNSDTPMPYMFVGDGGYPLRNDLMKPYPFQQMDYGQRVLNYRLSRACRVAENAFGILANRLRVFRSTICLEPNKVIKITLASLCLHNFLRGCQSEAYTPPAFADWENGDHAIIDGTWRNLGMGALQPAHQGQERSPAGTAKAQRDLLRDYFVSPAGSVPWQEEHI